MMNQYPTLRSFLTASLVLVAPACAARAQDLYKSRAEMLNAAALNKQADAAIINAKATYDKSQAETAKIHEEIREKAAHNDLLETETYYKKRAQYQVYRDAQRPKPVSPGHYAERARRSAPAQLTSYQFDSESGALRWPTLFKSATYDSLRRRIDDLLESRTLENSGAGSQNSVTAMAVVDALKTALRDNVRRYAAGDYLVARKFLDAVALEVQRQPAPAAETLDRVAGR
jgi:hypothetical protein